ncbi:MAG TPA: 16S rRNA (uracil(1498)-N(3))-methyltransferase [Pseudolabrys sp.]|jgi:16S rRNA (uracil1498-N3)-methyltransferase|nr:16S rRNA (uracil(1498)-N(3))-methyltransferase [Pseudolabrys sp.]
MPRYDFRTPRLFVDAPLAAGGEILLDRGQANYLRNVLRLGRGDDVLLFNGRDGEWGASLAGSDKRLVTLVVGPRLRAQPPAGDLHFLFAPLKHARLDYVVQKAVEMGASLLQPVITRHTQVTRINLDRMRANVVEAAQQCGVLAVPDVAEPTPIDRVADGSNRLLIFCDESAEVTDPVTALKAAQLAGVQPLAVLIGPEGGFTDEERAALLGRPKVIRIALGPRVLRADTAAVAAMAVVQAVLGDWRGST